MLSGMHDEGRRGRSQAHYRMCCSGQVTAALVGQNGTEREWVFSGLPRARPICSAGDLFPGLTADKAKYDKLEAVLERVVKQDMGLILHDDWCAKVIQLYETKLVRHGIMVVGPAGAGKSSCYEALLRTLSEVERAHKEFRMNPKAITAPQMFGRMDATGDWYDGIFSHLWRRANKVCAAVSGAVCVNGHPLSKTGDVSRAASVVISNGTPL